jgi:predicted DNA-binding transcriptional regulator AlpA
MNDARILITDKAAADLLSMGRSTFWANVKAGLLPQPVKIGGSTRWRTADLLSHFQASATTTPSTPDAAEGTPPGCTPPAPHQIPGAPVAAQ